MQTSDDGIKKIISAWASCADELARTESFQGFDDGHAAPFNIPKPTSQSGLNHDESTFEEDAPDESTFEEDAPDESTFEEDAPDESTSEEDAPDAKSVRIGVHAGNTEKTSKSQGVVDIKKNHTHEGRFDLLTNSIKKMMFVSGETAEPSPETTTLIEEITRQQVIEIVSTMILAGGLFH
jgi:hypothetical protein